MSRREIILRNDLSTRLLDLGYNVFLPVFDEGIDLIAHRESDGDLKLIQQKGRWSILRKYEGRNIWIAFPNAGNWYLVPHDEMLGWSEIAHYLTTPSWLEKGAYHSGTPSRAVLARCADYILS